MEKERQNTNTKPTNLSFLKLLLEKEVVAFDH